MKSLENLVEHLKENETVKAYQKIEKVLLNHEYYQNKYQTFLATQKALVQSQHYQSSQQKELQNDYQNQLEKLKDDPLIHQYLTLQSEVDDLIKSITDTIEIALNKPFNDD